MSALNKRTRTQLMIEILRDPERKSMLRIFSEIIYLLYNYKQFPRHYFSRFLFKKGVENIRNYVPNKTLARVAPFLNDKKVKEVVDNKLYFHLFYSQFNLPLPTLLMYNHKRIFVLGGKHFEVQNLNEFKSLLERVFEQNPSFESIFIKKTYASSSGKSTFKFYLKNLNEDNLLNELYSQVIISEFIFQQTVIQHPDLDKITPSSLNTIRFDTFIDNSGRAEIISGFLKMSTTDSHVDNNLEGGCGVGIVMETGMLKSKGYFKARIGGIEVLTGHPLTKTKFENFPIPFFNEAKEIVKRAAAYMPDLRVIGWDVAIGTTGPVIIEGNSDYGINASDLMAEGYLENKTFKKVMQEIK